MSEPKKISIVQLGYLLCKMPAVSKMMGHSRVMFTIRDYYHGSDPTVEYARDLFSKTAEDVYEQWRGAILVLPDGTEAQMPTPEALAEAFPKPEGA